MGDGWTVRHKDQALTVPILLSMTWEATGDLKPGSDPTRLETQGASSRSRMRDGEEGKWQPGGRASVHHGAGKEDGARPQDLQAQTGRVTSRAPKSHLV